MKGKSSSLAFVLLAAVAYAQKPVPTGGITGSIQGPNGRAVGKATVAIRYRPGAVPTPSTISNAEKHLEKRDLSTGKEGRLAFLPTTIP